VVSTVHSPVVAEPHEDHRTVGPKLAQTDRFVVLIGQGDVGEIAQGRDSTAAAERRDDAGSL